MGFLDESGLAHFWEKIKSYVDARPSGYIPGNGLSLDENTLNLTNPVHGILTQAEYNALSDEEKANGTYFVDDGMNGGGSSSMEVYDDQERVIGIWFGKPLYRRVISGTTGRTGVWVEIYTPGNVDELAFSYGSVNDPNDQSWCTFPNQYVGTKVKNHNVWLYIVAATNLSNQQFIAVIEYTKTTDSEVSE